MAAQVNGYTKVTEQLLENKVARSFVTDMAGVWIDLWLWTRNKKWPSRLALLNSLAFTFPEVRAEQRTVYGVPSTHCLPPRAYRALQ